MPKIIIGYFEQVSEVQRVLQDLLDHGFDRDDISTIAHQDRSALEPGGRWAPRLIAVPGVGPVMATGPLAAGLSAEDGDPEGAGLRDVLEDYGIPADEAQWYLDAVRSGGVLVAVEASDADADRAVDVMNRTIQPAPGVRGRANTAAEGARTGIGRGEDVETLERSIDLDVPVQTAYWQWTRFEEFPRFMEGVEEVRRLDGKRLHWVANVGGTRKEWQAQITDEVPNERIAWRSEAGEFTAGEVAFRPITAERSHLRVRFDYQPHGAKETLGDWLGLVSRRIESDLERFKRFVEAHGREPAAALSSQPPPERTRSRTAAPAATASSDRPLERDTADLRGRHQATEGEVRVPVVEEQLEVGKRQVQRGGVRLYTRVTERPVEETVRLRDEQVHVERRAVDRPASAADLAAVEEGAIEVTETDEEPVVHRQARVVEEVVVRKDVEEHAETVQDRVRRSEVEVEPLGAEPAAGHDWAAYERDFRTHASTVFASRGQTYEHWAPAYRYGSELAADRRYRERDWAAVETDARRDWEQRHQGTWEEFKEAIRYGWEKMRGRR
jgi:uncharacterized protein (TIGR02271 family)